MGFISSKWLPNILTILRMIAVLPIMFFIKHQHCYAATGLFIGAALTDYLDGYFARLYNAESLLGKILDVCADKCLLLGTIVMFYYMHLSHRDWVLYVIITREVLMIAGTCLMIAMAKNWNVEVPLIGKIAMFFQFVLFAFILLEVCGYKLGPWFNVLAIITIFTIVWSILIYFYRIWLCVMPIKIITRTGYEV